MPEGVLQWVVVSPVSVSLIEMVVKVNSVRDIWTDPITRSVTCCEERLNDNTRWRDRREKIWGKTGAVCDVCDERNREGKEHFFNLWIRVQEREEAVPKHGLPVSLRQEVALQTDRGNRANHRNRIKANTWLVTQRGSSLMCNAVRIRKGYHF